MLTGLVLAGCAAVEGPTETLDPHGPYSLRKNGPGGYALSAPSPTPSTGQVQAFELAYRAAYGDHIGLIDPTAPGAAKPLHSADAIAAGAETMAETGMALATSYCDDYFDHAGSDQKWLLVGKDVIAVVGTLATGTLAIASPANSSAAAASALFTGTAYNAVDLYTRNFLFGADNIRSVQTMIDGLLAAHTSGVLNPASTSPPTPATPWTFDQAVAVINDHQALCTPAAIRDKVLTAIAGGQFKAYVPAGTAFTPPATPQTAAATGSIGEATNAATAGATPAAATAAPSAAAAAALIAPSVPVVPGTTAATIQSNIIRAARSRVRAAAAQTAPFVPVSQRDQVADTALSIVAARVAAAWTSPVPRQAAAVTRHVRMELITP